MTPQEYIASSQAPASAQPSIAIQPQIAAQHQVLAQPQDSTQQPQVVQPASAPTPSPVPGLDQAPAPALAGQKIPIPEATSLAGSDSSPSTTTASNAKNGDPNATTVQKEHSTPPAYSARKRRKGDDNNDSGDKNMKQDRFSSQNEWASTFFKWNGERNRFICDAAKLLVSDPDSDSSLTKIKCKHTGFEPGTKRSNMVVHLQKVHALELPGYLQERSRGPIKQSHHSKIATVSSSVAPIASPCTEKVSAHCNHKISAATTATHNGAETRVHSNNSHVNGPTSNIPSLNPYFEVNVYKPDFKFHAAHFVAYQGYRERLHGHNYSVRVKLRGSNTIGNDGYVIDYGVVKKVTRKICKELNEHFLCPMLSDVITITKVVNNDNKTASNIKLSCEDGTMFQLPLSDCALLPIVHATTEEIAIYLWGRILKDLDPAALRQRGIYNLEVIVSEAVGQESVFSMNIPDNPSDGGNCESHCCSEEYSPGMFCVKNYIRGLRPCPCHSLHD